MSCGTPATSGRGSTTARFSSCSRSSARSSGPTRRSRPRRRCPASSAGDVVWVEPRLVAEVEFSEWTHDGHVRQPSYKGLRDDKPAADVRHERPAAEVVREGKRELRLSNLDKLFWPDEGITKGDLARLLPPGGAGARPSSPWPAVHDAPLPRRRVRQGVLPEGRAVAHAGLDPDVPDARSATRGGKEREVDFPIVDDELALLWMVNMGCIDMNPWYSRVDRPDRPDFVLFDLDPTPEVPYAQTVEVALHVKTLLDGLGARLVPEDLGRQGLPHPRPARPPLDLRGLPVVRRARGGHDRAFLPEARHDPVGEVASPRRADRRQPERHGQDDRVGLLGAARTRARPSRRRFAGTRSTRRSTRPRSRWASCSIASSGSATSTPECSRRGSRSRRRFARSREVRCPHEELPLGRPSTVPWLAVRSRRFVTLALPPDAALHSPAAAGARARAHRLSRPRSASSRSQASSPEASTA